MHLTLAIIYITSLTLSVLLSYSDLLVGMTFSFLLLSFYSGNVSSI